MNGRHRKIDGYRITKGLGSGADGIVLQAIHPRLNDLEVAIKLLDPMQRTLSAEERQALQASFGREIWIGARLRHQALLPVIDSDTSSDNGQPPYHVTWSFADAVPLSRPEGRSRLLGPEAGRNAFRTACEAIAEIADGLEVMHSSRMWHLDIQEGNILVRSNPRVTCLLMDYGKAAVRTMPSGELWCDSPTKAEASWPPWHRGLELRSASDEALTEIDLYQLGITLARLVDQDVPGTVPTERHPVSVGPADLDVYRNIQLGGRWAATQRLSQIVGRFCARHESCRWLLVSPFTILLCALQKLLSLSTRVQSAFPAGNNSFLASYSCPPDLARVVRSLTSQNPIRRYRSAKDLANDLRSISMDRRLQSPSNRQHAGSGPKMAWVDGIAVSVVSCSARTWLLVLGLGLALVWGLRQHGQRLAIALESRTLKQLVTLRDCSQSFEAAADAILSDEPRGDVYLSSLSELESSLLPLASSEAAETCRQWLRRQASSLLIELNGHSRLVRRIQFSKDGKLLFSTAEDGYVISWSVQTRAPLRRIQLPINGEPTSLSYSDASRRLCIANRLGDIVVLDEPRSKVVTHVKAAGCTAVALSPAGDIVAWVDSMGRVSLETIPHPTGKTVILAEYPIAEGQRRVGSGDFVGGLTFSSSGRYLLMTTTEVIVRWDLVSQSVRSLSRRVEYGGNSRPVALPDGDTFVVTASKGYGLLEIDAESLAEVRIAPLTQSVGPNEQIGLVAAGEHLIAGSSRGGAMVVVNRTTQRDRWKVPRSVQVPTDIAISSDDNVLAWATGKSIVLASLQQITPTADVDIDLGREDNCPFYISQSGKSVIAKLAPRIACFTFSPFDQVHHVAIPDGDLGEICAVRWLDGGRIPSINVVTCDLGDSGSKNAAVRWYRVEQPQQLGFRLVLEHECRVPRQDIPDSVDYPPLAAFSDDRRWLALGNLESEHDVEVVDLLGKEHVGGFSSRESGARIADMVELAFETGGYRLAAIRGKGSLLVGNILTLETQFQQGTTPATHAAAAFLPGSQELVTTAHDGVHLFSLNHIATPKAVLRSNGHSVNSVAVSGSGETILAGYDDGVLGIWDRRGQTCLLNWACGDSNSGEWAILALKCSPDLATIATQHRNGRLRVWRLGE